MKAKTNASVEAQASIAAGLMACGAVKVALSDPQSLHDLQRAMVQVCEALFPVVNPGPAFGGGHYPHLL
jgi:hypothetical protein